MTIDTMQDLFLEQIRDLYSAETQITKALPKMAKGAESEELRSGFEEHLAQTHNHISRLEQIFSRLGEKSGGVKCEGMEGLLKEGDEMLQSTDAGPVRDAGMIAAAQRVEHYEMAGYGSAREFALQLGDTDSAELLQATLEEEQETDEKLSTLALGGINQRAAGNAGTEEEPGRRTRTSGSV